MDVSTSAVQVDDALSDLVRVAGEDHAAGGVAGRRVGPGADGEAACGCVRGLLVAEEPRWESAFLAGEPPGCPSGPAGRATPR